MNALSRYLTLLRQHRRGDPGFDMDTRRGCLAPEHGANPHPPLVLDLDRGTQAVPDLGFYDRRRRSMGADPLDGEALFR